MTDDQIDRLLALADAATPGPWSPMVRAVVIAGARRFGQTACGPYHDGALSFDAGVHADARFIAAAREAFPALLRELRALRHGGASGARAALTSFIEAEIAAASARAEQRTVENIAAWLETRLGAAAPAIVAAIQRGEWRTLT